MQGSKAMAMLLGRAYVIPDDIKAISKDVMRHRIITSYEAQADGKTPDELIDRVLREIVVP
jgi:MoxR-like ATPase